MKKILLIFPLLLTINWGFRFNLFAEKKDVKFYSLFDEDTSSVSKGEIIKMLGFFKYFRADWKSEVSEELSDYDYIILSKGGLSGEEESLIFDFLKNGGGLILFLPKSYNEEFLKRLGVRTYDIRGEDFKFEFNPELFKNIDTSGLNSNKGILVKTGFGGKIKQPDRGNVFPERIPVRKSNILCCAIDKNGNFIGASIVLVKHWFNPWNIKGKTPRDWLLFSSANLNLSDSFYSSVAKIFKKGLLIKDARTEYASYEEGEAVNIDFEVLNSGASSAKVLAEVEIYKDDQRIYLGRRKINIGQGLKRLKFNVTSDLKPALYKLNCYLKIDNQLIDLYENAFIVKGDALFKDALDLKIKKDLFLVNDKEKFLMGVNYYESTKGELNWLWPDLSRIDSDFKLMKKMGFDIVRIHYHHPKWYRDYLKNINSVFINFFPEKKYLPIEEDLRILDSIIYLAQINGLLISLDLFTLLPFEMGNPRGWLMMKERIEDKEKLSAQLEFIKIIANRYKDIPGISWDLWNEPNMLLEDIPALKKWAELIIQEFRSNDDTHLITLGGNDSLYLSDILDYVCVHTNKIETPIFPSTHQRINPSTDIPINKTINKPVILQEFWLPRGLDEESLQADELRAVIDGLKLSSYQGFMPWQWTRQSRLWDQSQPEEWDDDLGLFLREDGSFKPAAFIFLE